MAMWQKCDVTARVSARHLLQHIMSATTRIILEQQLGKYVHKLVATICSIRKTFCPVYCSIDTLRTRSSESYKA